MFPQKREETTRKNTEGLMGILRALSKYTKHNRTIGVLLSEYATLEAGGKLVFLSVSTGSCHVVEKVSLRGPGG